MPGSQDDTSASSAPASEARGVPRWRFWLVGAMRPLAALVLVALIGRHLLTGLDDVPFHVDEDAYLSTSYLYRLFVKERRWRCWYWHRDHTHEAPVLSRYAIALGVELAGEPLETSPHKFETWWATQQHLPTTCERFAPATLRAGRRIAAVASVGSCVLLLLLGWRALGWPTALAAAVLLGWNPLLALSGRRAMAEGPLLFFWLLTVLLPVLFFGVLIGRSRRRWLEIVLVVLFGVLQGAAVGLAAGTKLSAGLTAIATAALLVVLVVGRLLVAGVRARRPLAIARAWLSDRPTALLVLASSLAMAVSIAVFLAPNPGLWADPVGRTRTVVHQFGATAGNLQRAFAQDRIETREEALRSVVRLTLLGDYVSFLRVWPRGVYAALFLLGFVALVVEEVGSLRRGKPTPRVVVALWLLATVAGTVVWLPLEWERYYLPLIPCVVVLVAHGGVSAVRLGVAGARDWWVRRRGVGEPTLGLSRAGRIAWYALMASVLGAVALGVGAKATTWTRRTRCEANLRRLAAALKQYREDTGELPPWLSCLYPKYVDDVSVFVCPCDPSGGTEGGVPPWSSGGQFPETDDTATCRAVSYVLYHGKRVEAASLRNPAVPGCSYVYEYCAARCSWWPAGWRRRYPDLAGNRDGVVSWQEAKALVEERGLQPDGTFDPAKGHGGDVPIIRCFWHLPRDAWDTERAVLNVRVGDGSIYRSDGSAGGWQRAASR